MNPAIYAAVIVALMGLTGYGIWRHIRPRHLFIAHDFNLGTEQPYRLKTLAGTFTLKRPGDKKKVLFPIAPGFHQPRIDGKGIIVHGDLNTGQLVRPVKVREDGSGDGEFEGSHGIFVSAALADGRVDTLVRSTKGSGITLKHILIGLAIVGGLVCIVIYQFAKAGGVPA